MNADEAREAAGRATAYLDCMEQRFREQGRELVNIDDGMHRGDPDLTAIDLRAVLVRGAELEAENAKMREQRIQQQRMAYRTGWDDRGEADTSAIGCGGFMEAERRAKGYTDWLAGLLERHANEKSAQQPERFADECDCECQPGQPCLCPERDCYCGPCRVCGENPQQRDTAAGGTE